MRPPRLPISARISEFLIAVATDVAAAPRNVRGGFNLFIKWFGNLLSNHIPVYLLLCFSDSVSKTDRAR